MVCPGDQSGWIWKDCSAVVWTRLCAQWSGAAVWLWVGLLWSESLSTVVPFLRSYNGCAESLFLSITKDMFSVLSCILSRFVMCAVCSLDWFSFCHFVLKEGIFIIDLCVSVWMCAWLCMACRSHHWICKSLTQFSFLTNGSLRVYYNWDHTHPSHLPWTPENQSRLLPTTQLHAFFFVDPCIFI